MGNASAQVSPGRSDISNWTRGHRWATTPHCQLRCGPRDATGWVSLWRHAEIRVLEETAAQIEDLRAREDEVDARLLAGVVSSDPLMCLKLLAHV